MTPHGFNQSYAELRCHNCGALLCVSYGGWESAELLAFRSRGDHTCGMRPITVDEGKAAMQAYRLTHPGLPFEEECWAYIRIMKSNIPLSRHSTERQSKKPTPNETTQKHP